METTEEDEMRAWAEEYAKKNGWVLNPDKKILDTVIRGLVRNRKKFGEQVLPVPAPVRGQGERPDDHLPMHLPQSRDRTGRALPLPALLSEE